MGLLPSCKILSTVYDDITVNICYEIIDNMVRIIN